MLEEKVEVQETVTTPVNTPEIPLFKNYEIRSWKLSPRIYKILSASLVLNVVAILVMGQSNMLTRKGCESPLVGGVCQVLDMMDLGGELLGMDSGYVDGQFTNIDLANSDITFVDLTGREESQIKYPEGYFALANPEQFQPELVETANGDMPGFPDNIPGFPSNPTIKTTPGGDPGANPQKLPPPIKDPVIGQLPDFDGDTGSVASNNPPSRSPRMPRVKPPRVTPEKTPEPPAQTPTDPANMPTVPIDRTFLRNLGQDIKGRIDRKEVDIMAQFIVTATGKLDKTGKIDPATYKATAQANDPRIVEVVEDAIEAVNSGGYLKYLELLAGKDLQLSISQDNDFITGLVQTEAETETRAKNLKTIFTNMINTVKEKKERPEATEDDKDDLELLKNATVEIQGKKLVIKFAVPKATAHALIQKKLINNGNAQEPPKPSGDTHTGGSNPTAGR